MIRLLESRGIYLDSETLLPGFYVLTGMLMAYVFNFFRSCYQEWISAQKNSIRDPLSQDEVPKHIAIIMDGNRRFGREKYNNALQGHWAGGQTLVNFTQWAMQEGVRELTVYAFSTENWSRNPVEVSPS